MNGWHTGPMLGFDTETTGVDVETDRIVTASLINIDPTRLPADQVRKTAHMIAVDIDIPPNAQAVHGITTEQARLQGRPAPAVLEETITDLAAALAAGVPVVGMNMPYDLTLLDREARRWDVTPLSDRVRLAPVVDVRVLDKQVDRYRRGGRKLTQLCETYRVRIEEAHDSTWDALAACRVAWRICQQSPAIAGMDLYALHEAQIGWAAEQAASLEAHLRRTAPDTVVDRDWPLRPHREPAATAATEKAS